MTFPQKYTLGLIGIVSLILLILYGKSKLNKPEPINPSVVITVKAIPTPNPTPICTPNPTHKWMQRERCWKTRKADGDYPDEVYDFLNNNFDSDNDAVQSPCRNPNRHGPELMMGCVTYWALVEREPTMKKFKVKVQFTETVHSKHKRSEYITIEAGDGYLAQQVLKRKLYDSRERMVENVHTLSAKEIK